MGQLLPYCSSDDSSASFAKLPHLKRCPSCSSRLPLHAFYTAGRTKTGQTRLHSHCKRCKLLRETLRRAAKSPQTDQDWTPAFGLSSEVLSQVPPSSGHSNRVPGHDSGTKLCTSCARNKPLDKFYTAGRHKAGSIRYHSHCKKCKLENEAAQRMQPRKDTQEADLSEAIAGLPAQFRPEHQPAPPTTTFLQQLQASRMPQQPLMGPMPALLSPQQLQGLLMLRQHPAMFSNPVLQSQLAMLMWSQMQQQQTPMWPLHQPGTMIQPPAGQQPSSAAAQSASTHQPSCPTPVVNPSSSLSQECNSSGGSNDSGCMQTASGSVPKAGQSLSADPQNPHFVGGNQRFADDSDSAVTWADRAGRVTEQTACAQSISAGHPEASGTQFCLHNSGQLSGRDVTSSHLPEATYWPPSPSPQPAPSSLTVLHHSPYSALQRKPSGSLRASGHQTTADAIQLARAASNAAKQSLAATAAITADAALARKGSSSLLADLRQADRQWCEAKQASAPLQEQSPAKAPEVKRSSRQAARAADQSQAEARLASEQPQQLLLQTRAQQAEAGAVPMCHTGLPLLRWASRKRAQRVRNQRPRTVPSSDHFLGWTVSSGVLKPIAPRQQPAAATVAPRAVQAHMWAALPEGRAGRTEPRAVKYEPRAARAEPKLFKAEPVVVAPPAVQAPVDIAPAFIPRHSRKKGKVQRSAFE